MDSKMNDKKEAKKPRRHHGGVEGGDEPITAINVTPLVDVCLVLVIIMMVTAPMIAQAGIKVSASAAGAAVGLSSKEETVSINILKSGAVKINDVVIPTEQWVPVLTARVAKVRQIKINKGEKSPKITASISAEDEVTCDQVVKMLDLAKQCGADNLSLIRKQVKIVEKTVIEERIRGQ